MSEEKNIPPEEIPEQPVNKPADETASSAEPVTENEQLSTINPQLSTEENMEVHHHSHSGHGKKNWKNYFWEFLMLFLAVFCGFLAEYQLEHKIERERGRQYIHSYMEDLKNDIMQTDISIDELSKKQIELNNLSDCFSILKQDMHSTTCLNRIIVNSTGFKDFIYTDKTIQQLKNAGGLRLIENKEIADSISAYDATVREMHIHQDVLENIQQITKTAHNNMIDFVHLYKIYDNQPVEGLFLLSDDSEKLNYYFNAINDFRKGLLGQLNWMKKIKIQATGLLSFLQSKGFN